ncbi:MAG: hypothetical protein IJ501_03935 [Bacilli bacterium]|nr:hypothetical protein [Bacilli bacterium]
MHNKVEFKEVVELFINHIIYEIKNENEVPGFNIIFKSDAYKLFYEVLNNPFFKRGYYTPDIKEEDIKTLRNLNKKDLPTIYVKDHIKFFYYLTEITNKLIDLYDKFDYPRSARWMAIQVMKMIWLRMNINDFNDVELFLSRQLDFLRNNSLDSYKNKKIVTDFLEYKVFAQSDVNPVWDESTRCMKFKIYDYISFHDLPRILYDINYDICYIYGIQKVPFEEKIPEVNRLIYKLYRGNDQPNKILAMKLFINMLKENGITTIKIPTIQVLSYRYHELLSQKTKTKFPKKWTKERLDRIENLSGLEYKFESSEYESDLNWCKNIIDKEDTISKIKTEDFLSLIYRIINEDNDLILESDMFIGDEIVIKINSKVKKI